MTVTVTPTVSWLAGAGKYFEAAGNRALKDAIEQEKSIGGGRIGVAAKLDKLEARKGM